MKRRAQAGAVPPATKKRKSAKDENEAQKQTLHEYAAPIQDRTPSSSAVVATHASVLVDKSNTSSTSSGASNVTDKVRRTPIGLTASNRPPASSPSTGKYTAVVAISSQPDKTSRQTTTAAKAVSSISTQTQIATQISPPSALSPTINYTICWARVNRSPWWPGKILTGTDIPEELSKKRRTTGFQCVRLYNRDECNWVNPARITEYSSYPEGPEERKRPPVATLVTAMEMATADLHASKPLLSSSKPAVAQTTTNLATAKTSSVSPSVPPQTPSTIHPSVLKASGAASHSVSTQNTSAGSKSANLVLSTSRPALTSQHANYIQSNGRVAKAKTTGAVEEAGTVIKVDLTPGEPVPETVRNYVILNSQHAVSAPAAASKSTSTATKATITSPPLIHPQAVHRVVIPGVSNAPSPYVSDNVVAIAAPSRPSSKNGAKSGSAKVTSRAPAVSVSRAVNGPTASSSPNMMDVSDSTTSTHSSRAPSPNRSSQTQISKIGELSRPTEEFSIYKGSAMVGHAIISKPAALSWSGPRTASSSVDSLSVVASVRQRYPDGQSTVTPKEERHFIGMQNLGNTCYINSAIQCLATVSSFCMPLTSMLVSLDDVFSSTSTSSSSTTTNSVDESSNGRGTRRRGRNAPPPPPIVPVPVPEKKTRSRKSWCKYPDLPPHNPEDAKSNPLIASLVSILKTLSHPEHLIQHLDKGRNGTYPGRVGPGALKFRGSNPFPGYSNGTHHSSTNSRKGSSYQQLIANSSDEDMDVDPIGDDDEDGDEVVATGSSTSATSSIQSEPVPSKEVTKVLQAFQNSSGQLLDEKYYTDQHQDISEFILHLLEYTHDQLNTKKPLQLPPVPHTPVKKGRKALAVAESPRSVAHAADYHNLSRLEMECKDWYHYTATNSSPISDSFDGLLRRKRICPKGHTFTSYEIFRILTLHFEDENAKEDTLEHMFHTLRKPEFLDCRCSECGGNDNKNFSQVTDVYILPKYLIITLGRFKGNANDQSWWAHKIKTRVKFPLDNLNMAPLFDIAPGQPTPIYNLVAISNHKGSSIQGGHYFSYVRSFHNSEHWVCLNDTTVKEVRTDAIVTNQAYMLFYERQDK